MLMAYSSVIGSCIPPKLGQQSKVGRPHENKAVKPGFIRVVQLHIPRLLARHEVLSQSHREAASVS